LTMKWRVSLAVLAVLGLVTCDSEDPPRGSSPPAKPTYDEARRAQWLAGRAAPCRLTIDSMRFETGGTFVHCSEGRTRREAIACAKRAFERKQPFVLCTGEWGMDSYIETGVAGLADGNILMFYFDTCGPRYRGTCRRPNISFAPDDWPQCRTALVQQIDLKTAMRMSSGSDTAARRTGRSPARRSQRARLDGPSAYSS